MFPITFPTVRNVRNPFPQNPSIFLEESSARSVFDLIRKSSLIFPARLLVCETSSRTLANFTI